MSVVLCLVAGFARADGPQAGTVLYLNRCAGGCSFSSGAADDSISNVSSVVPSGGATLDAYAWGTASFGEVVECVRDLYSPFDVTVVDSPPGATPHLELVVAGEPEDLGLTAGTTTVAPFTCGFVTNGVGFVFANEIGNDPQYICESAGRLSGQLAGLDTAFHCPDVMSFLFACAPPKTFTDADVSCGEFGPRPCTCGGSEQNSYQHLLALYGPSSATPVPVAGRTGLALLALSLCLAAAAALGARAALRR